MDPEQPRPPDEPVDEGVESAGDSGSAPERAMPPDGESNGSPPTGSSPPPPRGMGRGTPPWVALERLDRQWDDRTPLAEFARPIAALGLTTDLDPRGWDYLGALVGCTQDETARTCEAWLEAQLAADAVSIGDPLRPRVELVPAGRLWYIVRTVGYRIVVIDGPGFPTPMAAAVAASRRYHAELLRVLEGLRQDDEALPAQPDDGPSDEVGPVEATASGAEPEDLL